MSSSTRRRLESVPESPRRAIIYVRVSKVGTEDDERMPPKPRPLADRFWPKVQKTDSCWLWTGALTNRGYGNIIGEPPGRHWLPAHRVAYQLLVGPVPDGLVLDHLCKVRHCVNPAHLEPTTRDDNANSRGPGEAGKNRQKTHCPRGHVLAGDNLRQSELRTRRARRCRKCYNDAQNERRWAARKPDAVAS